MDLLRGEKFKIMKTALLGLAMSPPGLYRGFHEKGTPSYLGAQGYRDRPH